MTPRLLATVGLIGSLGTALVWGWIIYLRERNWQFAKGKVVDRVSKKDVDGIEVFAPCFEFRDPGGRLLTFAHRVYGSERAFQLGQEVTVVFDPDSPETAHLHSLWTKYQPSWLALFIALCSLFAYYFPQT